MSPGHPSHLGDRPPDPTAAARLYDAFRGGYHALRAERELAKEAARRFPGSLERIRAADAFHRRAAVWAVTEGGAAGVIFGAHGFPVPGAVMPHEDAAEANLAARFAYADASAVITVLTARAIAGDPRAAAYTASLRNPAALLGAPEAAVLTAPVSVQLQLAAHYWPGPDAAELIGEYARLLGSGSSLVLTLGIPVSGDPASAEFWELVSKGAGQVHAHTEGDVAAWLAGAGLVVTGRGITDVRALVPAGSGQVAVLRPAARIVGGAGVVP